MHDFSLFLQSHTSLAVLFFVTCFFVILVLIPRSMLIKATDNFTDIISIFEKALKLLLGSFFYSSNISTAYEMLKIRELEGRIKNIETNLTSDIIKEKSALIEKEVNEYIKNNIQESIESQLNDGTIIKETVIANIKTDIGNYVSSYLLEQDVKDIQQASSLEREINRKENSQRLVHEHLEKEAKSVSMLKTIMINLFVLSTVMFLVFLFYTINESNFTINTYIPIVAVYFSLGAFLLYIIRTSHFRSSTLLAIKEDESNYYNLLEYLSKTKSDSELTENDVDIIRMIMTNRAEREHKAQHPYEVIMKGVSGTNVQFKGGKMQIGSNKDNKGSE